MNPFYFGRSQRPLFGIYHPPHARPVRKTGVVLCPPIGHEYARTHRVLRHLALSLADAGCHVMRFDWYGVGDSGGDGSDVDLPGWIADVGTAIEEIKDTSGVTRVSLVGVRLGAAIAMSAAAKRRDVENVVLWDPIVRGSTYLSDVIALNEKFLGNEYPPPRSRSENPERDGVLGQPLPATLRDQLAAFSLTSLTTCGARAVHVVASAPHSHFDELSAHLATLPVRSTCQVLGRGGDWDAVDRIVSALMPQQTQPLLQGMAELAMAEAE